MSARLSLDPLRRTVFVAAAALFAAPVAFAAPGDPLGPDFPVDSVAGGGGDPIVLHDGAGDYSVLWSRFDTTSNLWIRSFDASGTPLGPETPVGSSGGSNFTFAMDATGDFVQAWTAFGGASGLHVYAQRFTPAGVALDSVIDVGTIKGDGRPAVAMDPDGDFVVAWNDFVVFTVPIPGVPYGEIQAGHGSIKARRYTHDGAAQGAARLISSSVLQPTPISGLYDLVPPSVAMDDAGNAVVAWEDHLVAGRVIYAKRLQSNGTQGLRFRVTPLTQREAFQASVAMNAAGNFVVGWSGSHQVGSNSFSGYEIYARRYSRTARAQGPVVRVNTDVAIDSKPAIAMDDAGDFVLAWQGTSSDFCCVPGQVSFQRYAASGAALGGNVVVAATSENGLGPPSVSMSANGNFALAWNAFGSVRAQLFAGP